MNKKTFLSLVTIALLCLCPDRVLADENAWFTTDDTLKLGFGKFDYEKDQENNAWTAEVTFERPLFWKFAPFVSLLASTDTNIYGGAGLYTNFQPVKGLYITPSLMAGIAEDGAGKDMGHTLLFRTQLEMSYNFYDFHRLGVSYAHISNANQDNKNPGTETLLFTYQMPLEKIFLYPRDSYEGVQ